MSDHSELKKLAEAATPRAWTTDGEREIMSAESDQLNSGWVIAQCQGPDNRGNARYVAAANPAAVLALIAEVARSTEREIMQLAEIESLRKALTDVRESLGREYWDQYAGLDETRDILDAAMGKGEKA